MLRMHLDHIDHLSAAVARIDAEVDRVMIPFAEQPRRPQTIPGVGRRTAEVIIAEIGVDMTRFPTARHLASWAGMCPGNDESAGKHRSGRARKGEPPLRAALCEAAWAATGTRDTYLTAQYRHLLRRFGTTAHTKATFALGHTILIIAWHLLANHTDYHDLGADYLTRRNDTEALAARGVRQGTDQSLHVAEGQSHLAALRRSLGQVPRQRVVPAHDPITSGARRG
jgi:transposase